MHLHAARLTVIVPVEDREAADVVVVAARNAGAVEAIYVNDAVQFVKARFNEDADAIRFEHAMAGALRHTFRPLTPDEVVGWVGRRASVQHGGSLHGGGVSYEGVVQQVDAEHIRVMPFAPMGGLLPPPPPHADVRIDLVRDIVPR